MKVFRSASMPDRITQLMVLPWDKLKTVKESADFRKKLLRNATLAKLVSENFIFREKLKELNLKLNDLLAYPSEVRKIIPKSASLAEKIRSLDKGRKNFDLNIENSEEKYKNTSLFETKLKELEYYKNEYERIKKRFDLIDDRKYEQNLKSQIEQKTRRIEELCQKQKKIEKNRRLQEKSSKTLSSHRKSQDLQKDFFDLYAEFETVSKKVKKLQEKCDENSKTLNDLFNVNELLNAKHLGLKIKLDRQYPVKTSTGITNRFKALQKEIQVTENKTAGFKVQTLVKIKDLSLRLESSRLEEDRLSQQLELLRRITDEKSSIIGSLTERPQRKQKTYEKYSFGDDLYLTESLAEYM